MHAARLAAHGTAPAAMEPCICWKNCGYHWPVAASQCNARIPAMRRHSYWQSSAPRVHSPRDGAILLCSGTTGAALPPALVHPGCVV